MLNEVYYFERQEHGDDPAGWTVSKRSQLPDGDFEITEYTWGAVSLWFVVNDEFTEEERQLAYERMGESIVQ